MATLTVSFTLSAADQTRVVAAYQVDANADLNAMANASQVMTYIKKVLKQAIVSKVQSFETAADVAAIPVHTPPDLT